ncbi:mitochondrial assembly of ribosomal large subunit protein 1 [Pararge aegeria]|uniref:Mitochondrial assembly of ribosomal large subunit protein 1 n=2 Tax=Pararge aegeria TaxID=116150 RepID=A0A8S4R4C0_9NEOP|nr:mitochondrial assembly of ribosomal large subunit protein 1 [Pararge aegeria]CAH2231380.1 jg27699 [Pararge aegeria aegeria]
MFKKIFVQSAITTQGGRVFNHFGIFNSIISKRRIHHGTYLQTPRSPSKSNESTSPAIASKYQVITETNSPVIENTAEEIYFKDKYPIINDEFEGINLQRGKSGVFEIEELVDILQRENSKDIFVASVPRDINYVEYMCIVSARSKRHILALAEFVRKVYKKKCYKNDQIPRIEGKDSDEWMALDLGNIALHIFSDKTRKVYDLETLWSVGSEFDEKANKSSEVIDILENYSDYLKDLKPLA